MTALRRAQYHAYWLSGFLQVHGDEVAQHRAEELKRLLGEAVRDAAREGARAQVRADQEHALTEGSHA